MEIGSDTCPATCTRRLRPQQPPGESQGDVNASPSPDGLRHEQMVHGVKSFVNIHRPHVDGSVPFSSFGKGESQSFHTVQRLVARLEAEEVDLPISLGDLCNQDCFIEVVKAAYHGDRSPEFQELAGPFLGKAQQKQSAPRDWLAKIFWISGLTIGMPLEGCRESHQVLEPEEL